MKNSKLVLNQPCMEKKHDRIKSLEMSMDLVNLKELRDIMLQRRCGNGKLFMFGLCNRDRLGVFLPDLEILKKQAEEIEE